MRWKGSRGFSLIILESPSTYLGAPALNCRVDSIECSSSGVNVMVLAGLLESVEKTIMAAAEYFMGGGVINYDQREQRMVGTVVIYGDKINLVV